MRNDKGDERKIADRFFEVVDAATASLRGDKRDSLSRFCDRHGLYWCKYTSMRNPNGKEYGKYKAIDASAILYAYTDYGANPTYIITGTGEKFITDRKDGEKERKGGGGDAH